MIRRFLFVALLVVSLFGCEGNISLDWGKKTAASSVPAAAPASMALSQPTGYLDKASGWWDKNKPAGGIGVSFAVKPTPPPPPPPPIIVPPTVTPPPPPPPIVPPLPPPPLPPSINPIRVHFSGIAITGKIPDIPISYSIIWDEDNISKILGTGDYPDIKTAMPIVLHNSLDGVAIESGTRLQVWDEPNFEGNLIFDNIGPIILFNSVFQQFYYDAIIQHWTIANIIQNFLQVLGQ